MSAELRIESDFKDYYDKLSSKTAKIVYERFLKHSQPKGTALAELRKMGIATIEVKPVSMLAGNPYLVVYTNSKLHNGRGKSIMDYNEALMMHSNMPASVFYPETGMVTYKLLQIGKRRFRVVIQNKSYLEEGPVISFDEIEPAPSKMEGLPVFSIDYISTPSGLLAVDFNKTPNLSRLGMQDKLTAEEIVHEIFMALAYQ